MVDQEKHVCFVTPVERRDESTLLTIIKSRVVHPENLEIVSDCWKSYKNLPESGFSHSVVIHKVEFVHEDGRHNNSVESIWSQLKNWFRSMHGVNANNFESYLAEFCTGSTIAQVAEQNAFQNSFRMLLSITKYNKTA